MSDSASSRSQNSARSFGQWMVAAAFGILAAAFFFRAVQFGLKWRRHVVDPDANFKVLTFWSLLYFLICGAIAAVAYFLPRERAESGDLLGEGKSGSTTS